MTDSNFAYFGKVLVSGGCGGALLTLTGHPLDTIKVNIQTMKKVDGKMPFNNAFDCARKIVVSFCSKKFLFPILSMMICRDPTKRIFAQIWQPSELFSVSKFICIF